MPELPKDSGLPKLDTVGLLGLYKQMAVIRRLEEQAAKAYTQRKILGFCHLYIGQESVAVGAASATMDDYWLAAYREHGQALAKGITPRAVMAELFGKATGCSKGLGGSMHLYDKSVRFLGGYGIVGAHVPLANGVGWAIKQRKEGRVCVCFLGDGAAQPGRLLRGALPRAALQAARRVPRREQLLRDGHGRHALVGGDGHVDQGARRRHGARSVRRLRRRGRPRARRSRGGVRALGPGPGAPRGGHLPLPRPLDVRSRRSTGPRASSTRRRRAIRS